MLKILFILFIISNILFAKSIFNGNILFESDSYKATGNTTGRKNDSLFSSKLGLNYIYKQKDYQYGFMINSKFYEDKYTNKNISRISKLKLFYKTRSLNLEFGDVANNINPYVYSGSLKGIKVNKFFGKKKNEGLNLFYISGYKTKYWDDAFKTKDKVAQGMVAEAKYLFSRYKFLALSASSAKIDETGKMSKIIGFQSRWRISRKIKLKAYASLAKVKNDENATNKDAKAFKIQFDLKPLKYIKSNLKYEIVDSNYNVLFGKGSKDREKIQGGIDVKLQKGTYVKVLLKRYRDNIDGSLGDTRVTTDKKATFLMKPKILARGDFSLSVKKKSRDGRGVDTFSITRDIKLSKYMNKNFKILSSYQTKNNKNNNKGIYTLKSNNLKLGFKLRAKITKYEKLDLSFLVNKGKYIYTRRTKDKVGFKFSGKYNFSKNFYLKLLLSKKQNDLEYSQITNDKFSISGSYKIKTLFKQKLDFLLEKKVYAKSDEHDKNYNQYRAKLTYKLNF